MDTISAGATIACAMELTERGLLDSDLRFGRADLLLPTLEDIAYRRDLGDVLAEGSARLAESCGAPELSMSVKGLEMPAYDGAACRARACCLRRAIAARATCAVTCSVQKCWDCPN